MLFACCCAVLAANDFSMRARQGDTFVTNKAFREAAKEYTTALSFKEDAAVHEKLLACLATLGSDALEKKNYQDAAYAIRTWRSHDPSGQGWQDLEAQVEAIAFGDEAGYEEVLYLVDEAEPEVAECQQRPDDERRTRLITRLSFAGQLIDKLSKSLKLAQQAAPSAPDAQKIDFQIEQLAHRRVWAHYYELLLLKPATSDYDKKLETVAGEFKTLFSQQGRWTPYYSYILAGLVMIHAGNPLDAQAYFDYLIQAALPAGFDEIRQEAMYYKAKCLYETGRIYDALDVLETFRKEYPLALRSEIGFAVLLLACDSKIALALEFSDNTQKREEGLLEGLAGIQQLLTWQGYDHARAAALYSRWVKEVPLEKLSPVQWRLALDAHLENMDFKAAWPIAKRLRQDQPDRELTRKLDLVEGVLRLQQGKSEEALKLLKAAGEYPDSATARFLPLAAIGCFRTSSDAAHQKEAAQLVAVFDSHFPGARQMDELALAMGEAFEMHNKWNDALAWYGRIGPASFLHVQCVYQQGRTHWRWFVVEGRQKTLARARTCFKTVLKLDAASVWTLAAAVQLIDVEIAREDYAAAEEALGILKRLSGSQDAQWQRRALNAEIRLGIARGDVAAVKQAIDHWSATGVEASEAREVARQAGTAFMAKWEQTGQPAARQAALEMFRVGLSESLDDLPVYLWIAEQYRALGKWQDSLDAYHTALKLFEKDDRRAAAVKLRMAEVNMDRKAWHEAAGLLVSLEKAYPRNPRILEMLADALTECNDFAGALEQYRRLLPLVKKGKRKWFEIKYELARLHKRLGNVEQGKLILKTTLHLFPDLGGCGDLVEKYRAFPAQDDD